MHLSSTQISAADRECMRRMVERIPSPRFVVNKTNAFMAEVVLVGLCCLEEPRHRRRLLYEIGCVQSACQKVGKDHFRIRPHGGEQHAEGGRITTRDDNFEPGIESSSERCQRAPA